MSRVLIVADGLWNGGAERQLTMLVSSLPEGWTASVVAMQDGPYRPVLEGLGIDIRLTPRRYRFDVTPGARMWRVASDLEPDVVHSWGWMSTLAMVPYCRLRGIPLLNGTIRRGDLPPRRSRVYRIGHALSDTVVANSRAGLAAFGIPEGPRGRVIYNGFDAARLAAVPAESRETPPNDRTVAVMTARMSAAKDWQLFMGAARELAQDSSDTWRFIGMGDGPGRPQTVESAADLVAGGVVSFPEVGLEVLPTIVTADVGILLSDPRLHAEGCSNSIMEYMACGLPVVCTASGGNPELVEHGATGLLVPAGDVDALVSALRTLRADPDRARAMGAEGRRRLEERFTVERMTSAYVAEYESLIAGSAKADA